MVKGQWRSTCCKARADFLAYLTALAKWATLNWIVLNSFIAWINVLVYIKVTITNMWWRIQKIAGISDEINNLITTQTQQVGNLLSFTVIVNNSCDFN